MNFVLHLINGIPFRKLAAQHAGTAYYFERFEQTAAGVYVPILRVYDSAEYPPDMIKMLLESGQIRPVIYKPGVDNGIKNSGV